MKTSSHDPSSDGNRTDRRRWIHVVALLIGFALIWANWRVPVLRFAWQPLNLATFLIALIALPTAAVQAFPLRPRWIARALSIGLGIVSLGAVLVGFGTIALLVATLGRGTDPSFMPVRTVAASKYDLRVYRRDGGATTSYGAVVWQERTLVPGVRLVRALYRRYPAEDVRIEQVAPDTYEFDGRRRVGPLSAAVWW